MASHTFDHDGGADELFGFFKAWFVFVAALSLLLMAGGIYVVWLLLGHFGVVA
jgi:hypothetical protein